MRTIQIPPYYSKASAGVAGILLEVWSPTQTPETEEVNSLYIRFVAVNSSFFKKECGLMFLTEGQTIDILILKSRPVQASLGSPVVKPGTQTRDGSD